MPLRLAVFDLDGTLKQTRDPYVYLHRRLGTYEVSLPFFTQAMAGKLDYDEWLRLDVALWKGVERTTMESLFRENPYLPGARSVVRALKRAGVWVAVVSTGVNVQAEQVQLELGLDRIFANELLFEDGRATGQVVCRVPERGKGHIVACLQAEFGVSADECLAVGDGISDVDMFAGVRVGVAVNPSSEVVRLAASLVLEAPDLRPLLPRINAVIPGWLPAQLEDYLVQSSEPACGS